MGDLAAWGKLFVCPTPIGNLEDVTLRVLRVLKEVDLIASEDTRRTRILLNHYGIHTPALSYQEHNEEARGKQLIANIMEGSNVALVSDAGMPGISDPGFRLIRSCIDSGIAFEVLPGPDAISCALVSSGLPTNRFAFEGFLPRKSNARKKRLERIKEEERTLVFFEAPVRLTVMIKEVLEIFGNRRAVVARELTKKFEEIARGSLLELLKHFESKRVKGEIVFLVEEFKGEVNRLSSQEIELIIFSLSKEDKGTKEIAVELAEKTGLSKKDAYDLVTAKLSDRTEREA